MKRRDFLIKSMLLGITGMAMPVPRIYGASEEGYSGRLLITLQAEGGWDVSSFCDPKENQRGEKPITNWSKSAKTQEVGNILYAPFAKNDWFFKKYHQDMLVINGVDAQTNSHTTGVIHNWSGRTLRDSPRLQLSMQHTTPLNSLFRM